MQWEGGGQEECDVRGEGARGVGDGGESSVEIGEGRLAFWYVNSYQFLKSILKLYHIS